MDCVNVGYIKKRFDYYATETPLREVIAFGEYVKTQSNEHLKPLANKAVTKGKEGIKVAQKALGVFWQSVVVLVAQKVATYIQAKWKDILGVAAAWALIIVGGGMLYGFQATSLPLTIGLGCGFAAGILTGLATTKWLSKDYKDQSFGELVGKWTGKSGQVVQSILCMIAVTVVLAVSTQFPLPMGIIAGVFLGNYLAVKIITYDPSKEKTSEADASQSGGDVANDPKYKHLQQQIDQLMRHIQGLKPGTPLIINFGPPSDPYGPLPVTPLKTGNSVAAYS